MSDQDECERAEETDPQAGTIKKRVSVRGFFTCDIDVEIPKAEEDTIDILEVAETYLHNSERRVNLRLQADDVSDVRTI
jgi:hypothetical protein